MAENTQSVSHASSTENSEKQAETKPSAQEQREMARAQRAATAKTVLEQARFDVASVLDSWDGTTAPYTLITRLENAIHLMRAADKLTWGSGSY